VGFDAEFVGEKGGVVYSAARLQDQVFEEEVDLGDGNFETRDGNVLDCLDEEGNEDVERVFEQLFVRVGVHGGENIEDFGRGGDQFRDVLVVGNGPDGHLHLGKHVIDVFSKIRLLVGLFSFVTKFLDLFVSGFKKVRVGQQLLNRVSNIYHKILKLGISLRMVHDLFEFFLKQLPLFVITEGTNKRPKVLDSLVELRIRIDILLSSADGLVGRTRVRHGITFDQQSDSRNRVRVVVPLT